MNAILESMKGFCYEEDGVGVIELVLILVVLIALVLLFKESIIKLLEDVLKQITTKSKEVY